jgi:predicted outer membrane protein
MHRTIIAALPFMFVTATTVAYAQEPTTSQESPAPGSTDKAVPSSGPLDREEQREQGQGIGPEGKDLASPDTKVKPMTTPPQGIRTVDDLQFSVKQILVGARRVSELDTQAAKLAQTRAQSRAVKRLASDAVRENQATTARLMSYARKHEIDLGPAGSAAPTDKPVPAAASPDVAQPGPTATDVSSGPFAQPARTLDEQVRELKTARGPVVDSQYAQLQVEANEQTLASIATATESANDPELKSALDTWRASVKKRMETAKALDTSKR